MSLNFKIRWADCPNAEDSMEASYGEIAAWVGDEYVWGEKAGDSWNGIEWPLIEILEYLGRVWPFLLNQDRDPFGIIDPAGAPPSQLRTRLERRWKFAPSKDEDERLLASFELAHNLAKAFNGAWPSSLWVVRCGNKFIVESDRVLQWFDAQEVVSVLEDLGHQISCRVSASTDLRGRSAINRWGERQNTPFRRLLSIATGLPNSMLEEVANGESFDDFWELDQVRPFECREMVAAARMASNCLSAASLHHVLGMLKGSEKRQTTELDQLCQAYTTSYSKQPFEEPYEEGHFAAQWLREKKGLENASRIDCVSLLSHWNVMIISVSLPETEIDAVAAWGPVHGPVVLLNENGLHVRKNGAKNVTLAHEIGHLIIDRHEALPVAEVFGGKVMESIEARARAFAAEFLLPRQKAYEVFREQRGSGDEIHDAVRAMAKKYKVSKEVVAWQIRNSKEDLEDGEYRRLRRYVKHRYAF